MSVIAGRWLGSTCAATLLTACASQSPVAPDTPAAALTATLPIVVAGQSNAKRVSPYLRVLYPAPLAVLSDATQDGAAISVWDASEHPPAMWNVLADELRQPVQAFVWWHGESARDNPHYLDDDRDLLARVRAENGNPQLLAVIVRVLDLPQNVGVRAAQATLVAGDINAVLVSSDGPGFEDGASDHLTPVGYETVARRILNALR